MKIAFIWQGFDGRYGVWRDGLYAAMKLIEQEHEVRYFDFPLTGIEEFQPDVVLYWEAPCTINGKDAANYHAVCALPYKKALLFAGGPLEPMWVQDFDLVFVESQVNEEECERFGIPWARAFGVNTQIFKPALMEKRWDGFMQATFASWKRHELFAKALGDMGAVAGRKQEFDRNGYDECVLRKVHIFPELPAAEVAREINRAHSVLNTASYWGGGQRCTLEALACGVPCIVMSDSPKNVEFIRESGAGIVCDPDPKAIRDAVADIKEHADLFKGQGVAYVRAHWTERHYATALLNGIAAIL